MDTRKKFAEDDDPAPRGQRLLRNPGRLENLADRPGVRPIGTRRPSPSKQEREMLLRDVAIGTLAKNGFSVRQIARLFSIKKSRVHVVIRSVDTRAHKGVYADPDPDDE